MRKLHRRLVALACGFGSFGLGFVAPLPQALADTVISTDFTVVVNNVASNSSGLPIALGDTFKGTLVVDTSQAVNTGSVGVITADYSVQGGSYITVSVDGSVFTKSIDNIDVIYHSLISPPNTYLDRYFANAGNINTQGNDGIQFWIDQQTTGPLPTMLGSSAIPSSLDLSQSTLSTFILRQPTFAFQADFTSFQPSPVPLPAGIWLLLSGLAALGAIARRARLVRR
jgi:hypothetical protein